MSDSIRSSHTPDHEEALRQLQQSVVANKCWACGCLHGSLKAIEQAYPARQRSVELDSVLQALRQRLVEVRYDCLGCDPCHPPLAMNALQIDAEVCTSEQPEQRIGWPPLPGSYTARRYQAGVAVCALTNHALAEAVAKAAGPEVSIVGTLQTENLGIERLIQNVLANPNIRFLLLCGEDSRQAVGHQPGQSLVALARAGIDGTGRIIGAMGRRPVLRNVDPQVVDRFRQVVEVVDRIGLEDPAEIVATTRVYADRWPGPAEAFVPEPVACLQGYLPERTLPDPAGYFVVYVDRARQTLSLEHYSNQGLLDAVIEGRTAAELYTPAIEKGLISQLDHAAYLGKELARAQAAMSSGQPYEQDAAPQQQGQTDQKEQKSVTCCCKSSCGGTPS